MPIFLYLCKTKISLLSLSARNLIENPRPSGHAFHVFTCYSPCRFHSFACRESERVKLTRQPIRISIVSRFAKNGKRERAAHTVGCAHTVIKAFLRRKYRTIYRRAGSSAGWTLTNGRAHALLEATVIYSYTSGYYTYSVPITTNYYALFVQSEGTRVSTWWYASIFSRNLWRVTGLFIVCIVFIIMGINALRKTICKFDIECDDEFSSLSFVFLYVLSGISGQGCQKIPLSWSLRLTILSFLFMGMSLFCGFSSTLTSYLTIGITSVPLTSLKDVAEKRTHSLCVRNNSGAYIHFTVNGLREEDLMPEWKDLVNKDCPDTMNMLTIGSNLCTPGFVYLEGPDIFLSIYQQVLNQCHYVQLPQPYWILKLAFQHARSSKYRKIIDLYLMRLRSVGILDYLEKKWIKKEQNILIQPQWTDFRAVEYGHIHIVFSMLSIAALFSVLICVLENIFYRQQILPQEKTLYVTNRKIAIP
ncbi:uncharacterized protein LOC118450555 isoform X4 [Vespa mandarinia]|uniref:uncharacterized protein LOC118450555 isoform X4 n=1 Tax=Vespa mandarinia TaxID=7446 RepID=UPI00160C9E63|nr:uncharacterized protein LOC118450555 isoform X4 [Vespa mandarinia]